MGTITGTEGTDFLSGSTGDDTILGLGGNDTLDGKEGNDTIDGGAGSDVITGGLGTDLLTGGTGPDIFRDSVSGLNGDRITDFLVGDRIQITDLTKANADIQIHGTTLTFTGGSVQIDDLVPGRLVIRTINSGGIEIRLQQNAHNDFNGDGRSDVLWRNDNGSLSDWLAAGNGAFGAGAGTNVPLDWKVAGTGDFNGDGREDILWRNDSGQVNNWLGQPNGGWTDNGANASSFVSADWHIVGTADFNGDGRTDILWRNDSGLLSDWLATASGGFGAGTGTNVPVEWKVASTGDFNADGYDDILWRNTTTGQVNDWLGTPSGGWTDNGANASSFVGNDWHIVGTGDFNGDGLSDILWRHDSGLVSDWLANSNGGFGQGTGTSVPLDWHVASIGDFNGDAIDDILWRNDSGQVNEWIGQPNGGWVDNSANAAQLVSNVWHIQDPFL
jgi:hypothetical protein